MALLEWSCEGCGKLIGDGEGYLTVTYSELAENERAEREWEKRTAPAEGRMRSVTMSELAASPGYVHWKVLHGACDPRPDSGDDYWIAVERLRTLEQVIGWTAHLLGKDWIQRTDWAGLLRRVSGELAE